MDKSKLNHTISVDAETGKYWDGQRSLTSQAQINSVIKKASTGRSTVNVSGIPLSELLKLVVMKIILMLVVYFEVDSIGLV